MTDERNRSYQLLALLVTHHLSLITVFLMPGFGVSAAHREARYRCFLPDLAGFASVRCTEPEA